MLIGVCRIGGFGFDFKNAGFTFVYVSRRQLILAFDLCIQTFGNQRMLTKLDAEKQIYRCHDMKLLLLLQKDYDLCCQLQTL